MGLRWLVAGMMLHWAVLLGSSSAIRITSGQGIQQKPASKTTGSHATRKRKPLATRAKPNKTARPGADSSQKGAGTTRTEQTADRATPNKPSSAMQDDPLSAERFSVRGAREPVRPSSKAGKARHKTHNKRPKAQATTQPH